MSEPTLKRIAVFGGRDYRNEHRVRAVMTRVLVKYGSFVLVHGACNCANDQPNIGADYFVDKWAWEINGDGRPGVGVVVETHPALWDIYGKGAGPKRNREMVQSGLDGAIAFPGGRGTADMRAACEAAGVKVWGVR